MGAAKAIGNFSVYLMIGLAISIIFLSLLINNIFENTEDLDELLLENAKVYITENKEELRAQLSESNEFLDLKKEQLKLVCASAEIKISDEFCNNLDTMEEQEAKEKFLDEILGTQLAEGYFDQQLAAYAEQVDTEVTEVMAPLKQAVGSPAKYLIAGIITYLIAAGLLFLLSNRQLKQTAYKAAKNTFLNILPFIIVFGCIAIITPEHIMGTITKAAPAVTEQLAQLPESIVNMVITIVLDVFKQSTNPLLTLAIVLSVISLAIAITMKVLIKKEAPAKK